MNTYSIKAMESAGRLYKISLDNNSDLVEKVFEILKFVENAPLDQTVDIYRDIKNKWLTLAEVTTAKNLTQAQKIKVEKYINDNVGNKICFLYEIDPKIIGGIKVRVGDNVFDESVVAKIRDLTL
ncbi:MAG: F0F1 ATP synthase subunit delta [Patescibacteria group bacterium]